mmetsp:Transcript_13477/g.20826  ORF Transcript_13477/g.20826 Transcript_13477/m.20826 type:complete len:199 (-) Transcript_13477:81-677(-)|eukprot:CAMPEP_0201510990 /NCGR_PEP_ID=MMETSP0161_2-20130828/3511_1 /ASSEMBLY_ACC=CAM_ASM_000251 /TAXON_ID=180227 /ORGANISM="Neoparamoeba aestuarina, Strain SoJaBio B1-5/56/2" /LENGTH=198 /DNA_ID=CAMNT_0047906305 /DNA_START=194 /DNA_END=790 /DNA_ORIENTATION=+
MKTVCLLFSLLFVALVSSQAGGWVPIDPTTDSTVNLAKYAIDQINEMDDASCYLEYKYERVLKAYRQLVAGTNYGFEIEVNTSMTGLCHIHYSEGLEILRNVVVYKTISNDTRLTRPPNKESLVYSREQKTAGQSCNLTGDDGCDADSFCNGDGVCQERTPKGEDCQDNQRSPIDDECAVPFYCQANGDKMNCMQAAP